MPCSFTYNGTTPATVVNFLHAPQMGEWRKSMRWLSPSVKAGGGGDVFVKDKSLTLSIHTLTWGKMYAADRTALLAFLDAVDGINNEFSYVDPTGGDAWQARIWNSQQIRESLVAHNRTAITVELLILQQRALTKHDTVSMTDAFGRVVSFIRGLNDSMSLSDICLFKYNGSWIINPPPADSISLSDLRAASIMPAGKSENISLSDSMHARFGLFGYLTDELGNYITDESGNYIIVGTGKWLKAAQDSISMSDAMSLVNTSPRYLTDENGNYITDESGNRIRADEIQTS